MEGISQENLKAPAGKLAADALAAEQLKDTLKAAEVSENDFAEERTALLAAQKKSSGRAVMRRTPWGMRRITLKPKQETRKNDTYRHQEVSGFNLEKRAEMEKLKKRLHDIDAGVDYAKEERRERRTVFYDSETKQLFVDEDGEKKHITFGDIVADIDWGIKYEPDESCPREIWRKIRKLSDLTEARQNIRDIFNHEISILEKISLPTTSVGEKVIEKNIDKDGFHGIIGERMAKNILMRISYNNPEVLFRIEESNAIEDAELKYDFKVYVTQKTLGVALEGDGIPREEFIKSKKMVGIQFTVASWIPLSKENQVKNALKKVSEEKFNKYVKRKVDDIVLVKVPLKTYREHFKQWLDAGKPSGGPEQFLSEAEKKKIVDTVLSNLTYNK